MTTHSLPPSRPCVALGAAGTLTIVIASLSAADDLRVADQADWTLIGIAGTAAVALAALLWVLAARRALDDRLAAVLGGIEPAAAPVTGNAQREAAGVLVASAAMARYHRAACPLAAGKPVRTAARDAHETAGRQPCGVCAP